MMTHTKSALPMFASRFIGILILILILITLSGVFVAYRYQQPLPVCGDQFAAEPVRFSRAWWTCPKELNRHARVIGNIGNQDLVDVKFSTNNLRGWALSDDGRVFGTVDGGLQWTMLSQSEIGGRFTELRFDENGLHGWILGGSSVWTFGSGSTDLLTTNDGGKSWTPYKGSDLISGLKDNSRGMVWAKDGNRVWLLGAQNTILHSTDGGKQWKRQFIGTKNDALLDIAFDKEGKTGWAVGELRSILKTTDGGEHWQRIRNFPKKSDDGASANDYLQTYFSNVLVSGDGQQIWITSDEGKIIRSIDAGLHWYLQPTPFNRLKIIQISDNGLHWWAINNEGYESAMLIETHDAGKTWLEKKTPANFVIRRVAIAKDNQHLWMVGAEGGILASNDAGVNWTIQASQFSTNILDLYTNISTGQAWFTSNKGLWRSRDSGNSWMPIIRDNLAVASRSDLSLISFDASGQNGIISGRWSKYSEQMLRTLDGGNTWQPFSPQSEHDQNLSSRFEAHGFFMTKDGQYIVLYDPKTLFWSNDHGKNWAKKNLTHRYHNGIDLGISPEFCSVYYDFSDGGDLIFSRVQYDWSSSHFCRLSVKVNGENRLSTESGFQFRSVEILNKDEKTWSKYSAGKFYPLMWLSLTEDGQRGLAVSEQAGKIIASEDRGKHWREYTVPTSSRLNTVRYSSNEKQVWAVGEHNAMFMSEDNGKTWQTKGQYQRLPPPWFYVLCLGLGLISVILILLWISARYLKKSKQTES